MLCINLSQINDTLESESKGGQRYSMSAYANEILEIKNSRGNWRMHSEVAEIEEALRASDERVLQLQNDNKRLQLNHDEVMHKLELIMSIVSKNNN